jgi:hypothetical protein
MQCNHYPLMVDGGTADVFDSAQGRYIKQPQPPHLVEVLGVSVDVPNIGFFLCVNCRQIFWLTGEELRAILETLCAVS